MLVTMPSWSAGVSLSFHAVVDRQALLSAVYGPDSGAQVAGRLDELVDAFADVGRKRTGWTEADAWMIAYPDQFSDPGQAPLEVLGKLLDEWRWLTGVHILPCYPWSSDDGFSVTDHEQIEPSYGTWEDIEALARGRTVMLDAVINHMSAESAWFRAFLAGDDAYAGFFAEEQPGEDYSTVVRPRTTPLFHQFEGAAGPRSIWTTFSADQVDLDYSNPDVLVRIAEVLLTYCARGATALRLDAIGFLWKQSGSTSIHLPQTHQLIAVLASVVRSAFPGVLVVSEVNVPHVENLTYLGTQAQPESDLIYQFTLAPLILNAVATGDVEPLVAWANSLRLPRRGVSFLNFLASHDGVGVRPAEGLVSSIEPLLQLVDRAGGAVSYRELPGGERAPYELNSTWFDLVTGADSDDIGPHLATHALMLAMPGIPLIYAHSLFGSRNDHVLHRSPGRARSLNRHKFERATQLRALLAERSTRQARVFESIKRMVSTRSQIPAFHPEGSHRLSRTGDGVILVERAWEGSEAVVAVNLSGERQPLGDVGASPVAESRRSGSLEPWEHCWFVRS